MRSTAVDADHVLADKSTGTDTDREGYRERMRLVENSDIDAVVVRSITRISQNMRDPHRTVGDVVAITVDSTKGISNVTTTEATPTVTVGNAQLAIHSAPSTTVLCGRGV